MSRISPEPDPPQPDPPQPDPPQPDASLDAAESLRIIAAQRHAVAVSTNPDGRVLFGAWGVAWLVGYLAMYLSGDENYQPAPWGGITFGGLLFLAIVITGVHTARRTTGLRGETSRTGAMFGAAWAVSFVVGFTVIGAVAQPLAEMDGGGEVIAIVSNGVSCLIVSALYMAGGAVWREPRMFALGAWIGIITAVATLVGLPNLFLVMALAGGGGFLAAALVEHLRTRRGPGAGERA